MKCPSCQDVTLVMTERQGVEIDYCPQCRGVWLDRGELDKLIERSAAPPPQTPSAPPGRAPPPAPGLCRFRFPPRRLRLQEAQVLAERYF